MRVLHFPSRVLIKTLILGGLAAACSTDAPTRPGAPGLQAARSSAGGGSGPQVNAADPDNGARGATLDVRVLGANFASGSKVSFLLNGGTTSHVKTNSTRFINSGELVANITISEEAALDQYDVQVTASGKKPGVGVDLFEVIGALADFVESSGTGAAGVYEDGVGFYDGGSFNLNGGGAGTGNFNLKPLCNQGRRFAVVFPAAWVAEFPADASRIATCDSEVGDANGWEFLQFHLPGLGLANCPDGSSCPIGGPHQPGGFGPDVNYFFNVDSNGDKKFSPNGKSREPSYNFVWTDAVFRVVQLGNDGTTPCGWHIVGTRAQLWKGDTALDTAGQSVRLEVTVTRRDGPCGD
jgi:hypothetical protein